MGVRISQKVAVGVVFVAALFMSILDATIVDVALPTIGRDFGVSPTAVDAISISFLVSLAVFIPASGWLGDRLGGKRVLLAAIALFTAASALCGLASSLGELHRTQLLEGLRVPPPEYADLIPATASSPPTVPGGYVLPVTGPRGTAGYLLAMESPSAAPAGVSVVQHIATVAALQLSMVAHERGMLRRSGAETLAEMLQGLLEGAAVTRRLAANGFAVDRPLRLAVIPGGADDDRVAEALASAGLPYLILRQQDELVVLVHDDEPGPGRADRRA